MPKPVYWITQDIEVAPQGDDFDVIVVSGEQRFLFRVSRALLQRFSRKCADVL